MAPFNFHLLLVLSFNFENVVLSLNQCPGHCNYFAHLLWHLLFMNCYRWYVRKSSYTWYTQSLYLVLIAVLQAFLFGFIMLRPCYAQKLICVQLFVTPWSLQASLSLGFSRQEYWRELPFLPPGDLPDPGIKAMSLKPPALADGFFTTEPPGKPQQCSCILYLYEVSILWSDFSTWTIEKHVLHYFLTLTVCENECSKSKKKRTTKKGKCKQ